MSKRVKVELGCGNNRRDVDDWKNIGIDIIDSDCVDFICNLGFERIPLDDDSVDLVQAIDVFEHIPRTVFTEDRVMKADSEMHVTLPPSYHSTFPFIFLMNEIYRISKDGAKLVTQIPFSEQAFYRDPTHVNRFAEDWHHYFKKTDNLYYDQGIIKCNFVMEKQNMVAYTWGPKDIMHTTLVCKKSEELKGEPLI